MQYRLGDDSKRGVTARELKIGRKLRRDRATGEEDDDYLLLALSPARTTITATRPSPGKGRRAMDDRDYLVPPRPELVTTGALPCRSAGVPQPEYDSCRLLVTYIVCTLPRLATVQLLVTSDLVASEDL